MRTELALAALAVAVMLHWKPARAERIHPVVPVPAGDDDADGVPNEVEGNSDTDGDGLLDRMDPDSDGDRIPDSLEDRNGDGVVQAWETDRISADTDGDGLLDGEEDANHNGIVDPGETSPLLRDTDGDWLDDGEDQCPLVAQWPPDSHYRDGCVDRDRDGDGYMDSVDKCDTLPEDFDGRADEDGCPDDDRDGDGLDDFMEEDPANKYDSTRRCLDPDNPDTDGDHIKDGADSNACNPGFTAGGAGCDTTAGRARAGSQGLELALLVAAWLLAATMRRRIGNRGRACTSPRRTSASPSKWGSARPPLERNHARESRIS